MRKISLTLFLVFVKVYLFSQSGFIAGNISESVMKVADSISMSEMIQEKYIDREAYMPQQYLLYIKLLNICTEDELVELTNHPDPKVRGYAYMGLVESGSGELIRVLLKNETDTALLKYQSGCVIRISTVIDFMINKSPWFDELDLPQDYGLLLSRLRRSSGLRAKRRKEYIMRYAKEYGN